MMEGIWHGKDAEILNIKGFVSDMRANDGQDAGTPLMIGKANFMTRYLDEDTESFWQFRAVRETPGTSRDVLRFRVFPHSVKALELKDKKGRRTIVSTSQDEAAVRAGIYRINDVWTRRGSDETMVMVDAWPVSEHQDLVWEPGESHVVSVYRSRDFKPIHTMRIHVADSLVSDVRTALEKQFMAADD
jgi:hypothetical protein